MKTGEWELSGHLDGQIETLQNLLDSNEVDPALLTTNGLAIVKRWLASLHEQRAEWREKHPEAEEFKWDEEDG